MHSFVLRAGNTPAEPMDLEGMAIFMVHDRTLINFGSVEADFKSTRLAIWLQAQVQGKLDVEFHYIPPDTPNKERIIRRDAETRGRRVAIVRHSAVNNLNRFRGVEMTLVLQHLSLLTGKGYFVMHDAVRIGIPTVLEQEGYHEHVRRSLHGGVKMTGGVKLSRNIKI